MTNSTLGEIAKVLHKSRKVIITCHARPDGDALGSGLALCLALKAQGKQAYMLCEEAVPERLDILPAMKLVVISLPMDFSEADLFITVDAADASRIGVYCQDYMAFRGNTLNIDHHVSNQGFARYNYVVPDSTATCEILPEIFEAADFEITKEIADLIALGLITDSGNFSHNDVSAKTFAVASMLRAKGADTSRIGYLMFTRQTKGRALLFAKVLGRLRFALDGRLAFINITQKDFEETGTDKSHTEGFVDYALSIDEVEVSISLLEVKRGQFKASLRSKRANVNAVASSYGGGGHVLASGCMLFGELEEVIDRLTYSVYQQL